MERIVVRVLVFGHYRDVLPDGVLRTELPSGATVADVARLLEARDARFADLGNRTRCAVNTDFCDSATVLRDDDEVAFLPPMSGG
ncbi:MAG: MoaD/ThiS family protein [Capsulimonadales bacterium]|nr:MoaD/ThiS family protein [Capsulimonadales bacterium]